MELVTLGHVTFNRIGSASKPGFARHNEVCGVREIQDGSTETLRELVLTLAEENGEARENLRAMEQVTAPTVAPHVSAVVFNIQGPNVQYSTPYAVCYAHPALKVGDRYFKLEEVEL
jgi:hypothetical protein